MLELISAYSISEIITFIILLCAAIKGAFSFGDWAWARFKKVVDKENEEKTNDEKVQELLDSYSTKLEEVHTAHEALILALNEMNAKVSCLIQSDKDAIKSFITKEHHYYCYRQKWIDDYSLDCIEKRFGHYVEEGGNSFIESLMNELRDLPKTPPEEEDEEEE